MITIQKLPLLEPEMRGALRSHIMRKRQRLKQELEQDAIEKRMKKEREQKRIQDAMTLDQIKEQLSTLEKRLEALRNEKHDLFVKLKQVLNEGSSKRKQPSEINTSNTESTSAPDEQAKRPKTEEPDKIGAETPAHERTSEGVGATTTAPLATISTTTAKAQIMQTATARVPIIGSPIETITPMSIPRTHESRLNDLDLAQRSRPKPPPQHSLPYLRLTSKNESSTQHQHSARMRFVTPPISHAHSFMNQNLNQQPEIINTANIPPNPLSSMSAQQLAALQAHLSGSFMGPNLPGQLPPELLMTNRFDSNSSQRINPNIGVYNRLPLSPMSQHVLRSQQIDSNQILGGLSNLPKKSYPEINESRWDDHLLALKKGQGGASSPFNSNQSPFGTSLPPSLAHLNLLNQATMVGNIDASTSIGQSMLTSLGANNVQSPINFNARKFSTNQTVPRSRVDFLLGQMRPAGILTPNLGQSYNPQQSLTAPTSIFGPGGHVDLEHLNSMYHPAISQHIAGSMVHINNPVTGKQQQHQLEQRHLLTLHQQQQEHASRMFSSSNAANFHREPAPRNPFR